MAHRMTLPRLRVRELMFLVVYATLCVAIGLVGCHRPHYVNTYELKNLESFEAGTEVILVDIGGQALEFDENSELSLVTSDGLGPAHRYSSIRIQGGEFIGFTQDGQTVRVALESVHRAVVGDYDPLAAWLEGAAITGTVLVGVVVVSFVLLLALLIYYISQTLPGSDSDS